MRRRTIIRKMLMRGSRWGRWGRERMKRKGAGLRKEEIRAWRRRRGRGRSRWDGVWVWGSWWRGMRVRRVDFDWILERIYAVRVLQFTKCIIKRFGAMEMHIHLL